MIRISRISLALLETRFTGSFEFTFLLPSHGIHVMAETLSCLHRAASRAALHILITARCPP